MRAFQTICVALAAASTASAQNFGRSYSLGGYGSGYSGSYGNSYSVPVSSGFGGYSYGSGSGYSVAAAPVSYSTGYAVSAAPAVSTSYAVQAAPAVSYAAAPAVSYAAAPAVSYAASPVAVQTVRTVQAAPAVSYAVQAAPAVQYTAAAQATNLGVIATAPAAGPSVHEVHTGSGSKTIRLEEYQGGDQVIRVHEQASQGPQIAQVLVPGEQSHIRVINRNGPTQVQRVVHRQQTQVVDVQKPGRPGARIVQVVKGENPAPSVEFVNEGGATHQVYHADDSASAGASFGGASYAVGGGASYAASAAPVATQYVSAAPAAVSYAVQSAPAVSYAVQSAPAVSYAVQAAPVATSYSSQVQAIPSASYSVASAPVASYSGYSSGYSNSGFGGNSNAVVLDSYKKKSKA